jgi:hypothetical protein
MALSSKVFITNLHSKVRFLLVFFASYLSALPFFSFITKVKIDKDSIINISRNGTHGQVTHDLAALCAIALDEEPYLQEWVDYNIGLGFDLIYIYDNSDSHELKQWKTEQPPNIRVSHLPGISMQTEAYRQCAKTLLAEGKHKWAAFFDVDEFLVLRRHDSIVSFLKEYLIVGALGISWIYMGSSNRTIYEPMPVSYRFNLRVGNHTNMHIKTIAVLSSINIDGKFHCHYLPLKRRFRTMDTNGKKIKGPFNRNGPENVAALYHFFSKSNKEFVLKRIRGRADTVKFDKSYYETLNDSFKGWNAGDVRDDSVWNTMKKNVPKYSYYEKIKVKDESQLGI